MTSERNKQNKHRQSISGVLNLCLSGNRKTVIEYWTAGRYGHVALGSQCSLLESECAVQNNFPTATCPIFLTDNFPDFLSHYLSDYLLDYLTYVWLFVWLFVRFFVRLFLPDYLSNFFVRLFVKFFCLILCPIICPIFFVWLFCLIICPIKRKTELMSFLGF